MTETASDKASGLDLERQQHNLLLLRPLFELALKTRRGDASEPLFLRGGPAHHATGQAIQCTAETCSVKT